MSPVTREKRTMPGACPRVGQASGTSPQTTHESTTIYRELPTGSPGCLAEHASPSRETREIAPQNYASPHIVVLHASRATCPAMRRWVTSRPDVRGSGKASRITLSRRGGRSLMRSLSTSTHPEKHALVESAPYPPQGSGRRLQLRNRTSDSAPQIHKNYAHECSGLPSLEPR